MISDYTTTTTPLPASVKGAKVYRSHGSSNGTAYANGPFYFVGNATRIDQGGGTSTFTFMDVTRPTRSSAPRCPTTNTAAVAMQTIRVTVPIGGAGVAGRKLYRTAAGGSAFNSSRRSTIPRPFYDDAVADASLGAAPPTTNTAGNEYRGVMCTTSRSARRARRRGSSIARWRMGRSSSSS